MIDTMIRFSSALLLLSDVFHTDAGRGCFACSNSRGWCKVQHGILAVLEGTMEILNGHQGLWML